MGFQNLKEISLQIINTESDSVQCGYGSRLESNGFLAQCKRKRLRCCPRTVGQVGMFNLTGFFEAARRSGLDQNQVSEDTTTVWLCLHVESNPASGWAIVDIFFYVHHAALTAK